MKRTFSNAVRQIIAMRANFRCEYCHKPDIIANFSFHIEHIIGLQHKGTNHLDNLAYACATCNWKKGPNIGTLLKPEGSIIPLFNPRKDKWDEHFYVEDGVILAKDEIGEGTIQLLDFNAVDRILERRYLIEAGLFF